MTVRKARPEFAAFARFMTGPHFAAELVGHHLLAITDAENRHARLEQGLRGAGARPSSGTAGGRAGKD